MPLVSVLMTAFNREAFIAEAIESVLASNYTNFELIIVDDCSTDKTVEIAKSFSVDKRVQVYINERNLNQFQNRNRAAQLAKGKYLKFVDSDDIIYPHSLELMVDIMETHPDCGMGFCYTIGNSPYPLPHCYQSEQIYEEHYFRGGILFVGPVGTIILKSAFEAVNGFDLYGMPSDNHFSLKVAAKYPVVSMYRDLIWWRIHNDQAFSGINEDINVFQNYLWNQNILNNPECPLNSDRRSKAIKNVRKIFLINLMKRVLNNPAKIAAIRKLIKEYNIDLFKIVKEIF